MWREVAVRGEKTPGAGAVTGEPKHLLPWGSYLSGLILPSPGMCLSRCRTPFQETINTKWDAQHHTWKHLLSSGGVTAQRASILLCAGLFLRWFLGGGGGAGRKEVSMDACCLLPKEASKGTPLFVSLSCICLETCFSISLLKYVVSLSILSHKAILRERSREEPQKSPLIAPLTSTFNNASTKSKRVDN